MTPDSGTPASAVFRHPAEWEPHEATWISWPHNRTDWPGKFPTIPWVYAEIVRKISPGERLHVIVESRDHEALVTRILQRAGADLTRIRFFRYPTDRGWTRDMGPIFLRRERPKPELAIVKFRFNAWARYPDWKNDAVVPDRAARSLGLKMLRAAAAGRPFVLEGGAIDGNGRGTLLVTEECLLDQSVQVRNPGLSQAQTEQALRHALGVTNIIWLGRGIVGDDTHGHVDDICRFVSPNTVVLCREESAFDENYKALEENRERLEGVRLEDGAHLEVVPLPMPSALMFDGRRLPASYANFYITNAAVLVPTFNDPRDRVALGILTELFTDREVVGIHAVDLVWGFGTLHCLSHEQPSV